MWIVGNSQQTTNRALGVPQSQSSIRQWGIRSTHYYMMIQTKLECERDKPASDRHVSSLLQTTTSERGHRCPSHVTGRSSGASWWDKRRSFPVGACMIHQRLDCWRAKKQEIHTTILRHVTLPASWFQDIVDSPQTLIPGINQCSPEYIYFFIIKNLHMTTEVKKF